MPKPTGKQPDDPFGPEEATVVELRPDDYDTPPSVPRCTECGAIVFVDDYETIEFPNDRCLRSRTETWHWCCKLRKSVTFVR